MKDKKATLKQTRQGFILLSSASYTEAGHFRNQRLCEIRIRRSKNSLHSLKISHQSLRDAGGQLHKLSLMLYFKTGLALQTDEK